MEWETFVRIVDDLARIHYAGWFAFHNYNEPLANPRLLTEMHYVREHLSEAKTSIFTNGDYLTTSRLEELVAAGLRYLRVTLYPLRGPELIEPANRIDDWLARRELDLVGTWLMENVRQGTAARTQLRQTDVEVISPDLSTYNWRGGTTIMIQGRERTEPCDMTRHSMSIDYKGRLKMCCNVFPEATGHERFVIGDTGTAPILELWDSDAMREYRSAHAVADWSRSEICRRCTQQLPPTSATTIHDE
jgi:radical SAM protein with 4Fe4S-binding SPASM domain